MSHNIAGLTNRTNFAENCKGVFCVVWKAWAFNSALPEFPASVHAVLADLNTVYCKKMQGITKRSDTSFTAVGDMPSAWQSFRTRGEFLENCFTSAHSRDEFPTVLSVFNISLSGGGGGGGGLLGNWEGKGEKQEVGHQRRNGHHP